VVADEATTKLPKRCSSVKYLYKRDNEYYYKNNNKAVHVTSITVIISIKL